MAGGMGMAENMDKAEGDDMAMAEEKKEE